MIECQVPWSVSANFGSSMVMDTNWDGAIGDMGQHGWELVKLPLLTTKRGMECGIQLHWYCLVLIQLWVLMLWYLKEKINPIY
jgi:hypothetical protein